MKPFASVEIIGDLQSLLEERQIPYDHKVSVALTTTLIASLKTIAGQASKTLHEAIHFTLGSNRQGPFESVIDLMKANHKSSPEIQEATTEEIRPLFDVLCEILLERASQSGLES